MAGRLTKPAKDEILFVALGGCGEIGMNLYAYGHRNQWLIVDCGVAFGDLSTPGMDVLVADIGPLLDGGGEIVGLAITHAHEDHIGAIPHLIEELDCPVYATPFAASMIERKVDSYGGREMALHRVPQGESADIGVFNVEFVPVTHSIPEACALSITTSAGRVIHTGDWKIDHDPQLGRMIDSDRLAELGREGVLALVCDSTNALEQGHSGSEAEVYPGLLDLVEKATGRVAVTCFATNVARVSTVARVAQATGRRLALVGRSLHRLYEVSKENGYLQSFPDVVGEDAIGRLPREEVLMLVTGTQGEPRAALSKLARNEHHDAFLDAGDTVIYSSREIPGNEVDINRVRNQLAALGVDVLADGEDGLNVHVTGHPQRDELMQMYQWTQPKVALAVHGEARHQLANAKLALTCQVGQALAPGDGDVIRLREGQEAEIVQRLELDVFGLDGSRLIPLESEVMRLRKRMMHNGTINVAVAVNARGNLVADPVMSSQGVFEAPEEDEIEDEAADWAWDAVDRMKRSDRQSDDAIEAVVFKALRKFCKDNIGKRPLVTVSVLRV